MQTQTNHTRPKTPLNIPQNNFKLEIIEVADELIIFSTKYPTQVTNS